MLFATETIAGKEFKLRLGAQEATNVEHALGKSALDVFLHMAPSGTAPGASAAEMDIKTVSMPYLQDLCVILCGAMQRYHHGMTLKNVYDLYDEHIDAGGSYNDFIPMVEDVLEVSGYLPKQKPDADTQEGEADTGGTEGNPTSADEPAA
jgi:hypothetical protein